MRPYQSVLRLFQEVLYGEGFEKYNIEHGNFTLSSKASESDLKKIEKNGKVRICENFYRDEATDADLDGNEEETIPPALQTAESLPPVPAKTNPSDPI